MSVVRYLQRSVIAATILMYALPAFAIEQSGLMGRHSMPHRPPENRFLWKLPLRGVRHARPKNQSARNWERRKKFLRSSRSQSTSTRRRTFFGNLTSACRAR
jgi:hypothetical protein